MVLSRGSSRKRSSSACCPRKCSQSFASSSTGALLVALIVLLLPVKDQAFLLPAHQHRAFICCQRSKQNQLLTQDQQLRYPTGRWMSSVPPSNDNRKNDDDDKNSDGLDGFLNPEGESQELQAAREYMSETSLPISFDQEQLGNPLSSEEGDDLHFQNKEEDDDDKSSSAAEDLAEQSPSITAADSESAALVMNSPDAAATSALFSSSEDGDNDNDDDESLSSPPEALLANNPYMQVVSRLSPSELIAKFTATANPRVQDAVRTTILGLIGNLPKMAFDTTTITTGQRLASLMFQLQMTGYMFKNAEYRLSLSQSLGMTNGSMSVSSDRLLGGSMLTDDVDDDDDDESNSDPLVSGKIKGKLKIRFGSDSGSPTTTNSEDKSEKSKTKQEKVKAASKDSSHDDEDDTATPQKGSDGMEIEVDAAAYMSELRTEVSKLKDELANTKESKEEALRKDLLLYIRTLPAQELRELTDTMSQDVLVCMKGLVQAVLGGIGDGQIGPETVTEQSGEAMAQLCMWQLAVGYNLRELEVREEMKKKLEGIDEQTETPEGGFD